MRKTLGPILMLSLLAMAGCLKNTSTNPVPGNAAYHDAVVAEHSFTTALKAFQQSEKTELALGHITAAEHQTLEAGIGKVGAAAQVLVAALQAGAGDTTIQADFNTVASALTDLINNGVLGIKNAQSQATLKAALTVAQDVFGDIQSVIAQIGKGAQQ